MRYHLVILIWGLFASVAWGQSDKGVALSPYNLIRQANNIADNDPAQALNMVRLALEASYESQDQQAEALAQLTRGNIQLAQGNHLIAIEAFEKAYPLYQKLGNTERQSFILKQKAYALKGAGRQAEALVAFQQFYPKAEKEEAQKVLLEIAELQKQLGQTKQSLSNFQQLYDIAEEERDTVLMAQTSDVLDQKKDTATWNRNVQNEVSYYQNRLDKAPAPTEKADLNYKIGTRYLQQGNSAQAIKYLNESVASTKKKKDKNKRKLDLKKMPDSLGKTRLTLVDPGTAGWVNPIDNKGLGDSIQVELFKSIPGLTGDFYYANTTTEKEEAPAITTPPPALSTLSKTPAYRTQKEKSITPPALRSSVDSLVDLRSATYRKLAEAYELEGDYRNAWLNAKLALKEADSARDQEINLLLGAASNREALAIQEQQILSLEQDRKLQAQALSSQRILNLGLGVALLAIVIGGLLAWRSQRKRQRANQLLTLRSLVGQMNPHFIFNSLNTFNSYLATADTQQANRFLGDFSRLMRQVLDYSSHDFITLTRELEILGLYLKLEHGRFEENFDYDISVSDELDLDAIEIPPMLLQPYVENAIWHGLRYRKDKGFLKIEMFLKDEKVHITIADDGIGRSKSEALKTHNQQSRTNSLGMKNTARRAELIQSLFKKRMAINVTDLHPDQEQVGTLVHIQLQS